MTDLYRILVVCTGNVCRSPMGEGFLAHLVEAEGLDHVFVESAGTHAPEGSPASSFAVDVAAHRGVDIQNHRASFLDRSAVESADLILVMERGHMAYILSQWPAEAGDKVKLIRAFHPDQPDNMDVPDPIGADLAFYEATAELIMACCKGVIGQLKKDP
jgi:protein-tyrosine-phosphatase